MPWLADPTAAFRLLPSELRGRIRRVSPRLTACWLWTGPVSYQGKPGDYSVGYGRQSWPVDPHNDATSRVNWLAHRLIRTMLLGPIDPELVLDHLKERCTARRCVRPDHNEPVPHEVNTARGGGQWGTKFRHKPKPEPKLPPVVIDDPDDDVPF